MRGYFLKTMAAGLLIPSFSYFLLKNQQLTFAEEKTNKQRNYFKSAFENIPHYKKRDKGGEDAYICQNDLLAVADGVGGWNRKGIDPGIFARELSANVYEEYKRLRALGKKTYEINLKYVLIEAVKKTKAMGTSTFVIAQIDEEDGLVKTLNYGDSGVMVIRIKEDNKIDIRYRSKEQQHRFNCPYQAGTNHELPYKSDNYLHPVIHNDLVLLGTDGLFDNLFDDDIIDCIRPQINSNTHDVDVQQSATCMAKKAEHMSYKKDYTSPFAKNAEAAGKSYPGGKKDDITVVIGQCKLNNIL